MREEDLERLYTELEKRLCNVVFRWVWSMDEAQDVVQEAFVRLWRMRARVDMDTVEPLIYKIALNLAASRRRSRKIWRWVSMDVLRGAAAATRPADESVSANEDRARLRAAVESLPDDLRQVIVLCEYSELSYDQIAQMLSIPVGTVGSRRHRALRRLREQFSSAPTSREGHARETV